MRVKVQRVKQQKPSRRRSKMAATPHSARFASISADEIASAMRAACEDRTVGTRLNAVVRFDIVEGSRESAVTLDARAAAKI
jgi:hypothetical protein